MSVIVSEKTENSTVNIFNVKFLSIFVRFGEVFGPNTKPSEEEYSDLWVGLVYNGGYKVLRG